MSYSTRHSDEEIEQFISRHGAVIGDMTAGFLKGFGFIFMLVGGVIIFVFYMVGLFEEDVQFFFFIFPSVFFIVGFLIFLGGIKSSGSNKKTKSGRSFKGEKYRNIILYGKIIDAKIDEMRENYGLRVNGHPHTEFYLDIKVEKLKFKTFSPYLINYYRGKDTMTIYYYDQYPGTIIPYELVSSVNRISLQQNLNDGYREVSIS